MWLDGIATMPFGMTWALAISWVTRVYNGGISGVTTALKGVSQHTGVPVVVVAAVALVVSYRVVRRATRLAGELAIALALVLVATKVGWIRW